MRNPKRLNRGGAMVEFMMLTPIWLPLILGTLWIGSAMVRGLQVTEVARDAASMFCRGTDFSVAVGSNANNAEYNSILPNLASDLGTVTTTGNGVFIFSTLTYVGNSVCASLGSTYGTAPTSGNAGSHTGSCTNYGKFVFTQQYLVGNTSLRSSTFGTPAAADLDSTNSYRIDSALTYVTHTADRSTFNLIPAPAELGSDGYQSGQPIYVVEAYFSGRGQAGYTSGGDYSYAVF
jgi:Flp pilus assembly protein TadG